MSLHYIDLQASHGCILLQSQLPISTRTGNFPWFWGVYRRVFTHFRLTLPVQNVKREKLCLPNVHYEVWSPLPCYWAKFGQDYANQLKRRRAQPGDKWHLDEVFLTINGQRHYLWRAVDQDDNVLDILVQSRRNKHAAKKFFRKLLKGLRYVPRVIITDKLKSYGAAKREILPGVEHRQSRYLNNRCENSHRPTRQREYRIQGFKSAGHAQRFLSAYGLIAQHFRPRRHLLSALTYRAEMKNRFARWAQITGTEQAA